MRPSRLTEEQIIGMLKDKEVGAKTAVVCRKHGISAATFYKFKPKFGGMEVSDARRLKALESASVDHRVGLSVAHIGHTASLLRPEKIPYRVQFRHHLCYSASGVLLGCDSRQVGRN